jgi:hypothetical protein
MLASLIVIEIVSKQVCLISMVSEKYWPKVPFDLETRPYDYVQGVNLPLFQKNGVECVGQEGRVEWSERRIEHAII